MVSTSIPASGSGWSINTRLHQGANSYRSDSCQVQTATTNYLTSQAFSTVGYGYVTLMFMHICKVDYGDVATLEVSNDNGLTWIQVTQAQYMSSGQYGTNGNRFTSNSYSSLWAPTNPLAIPMNNWWRPEVFNFSSLLANCPAARIRYKLSDPQGNGSNGNHGWFIENIRVTVAPSELIPPSISLYPGYPQGTLYSTGPFTVMAKVSDASGIDTAYIAYSVNGGPEDTVGMVHLLQDTMKGIIPAMNAYDVVCWYIRAYDNSMSHNTARNPSSGCVNFCAIGNLPFPFFDDFDGYANLFTASMSGGSNTSNWQLGTPNFGETSSAYSPPKCWDVNLGSGYTSQASCYLTSPVFNFSNAVNARLSFWLNYETQAYYDGTRMEYTTNGTTWQTLGSMNDPLAVNWYNSLISSTGQQGWNGNSDGWKKSRYKLSVLNNVTGPVQFRFVFRSDFMTNASGVSVDDFSISLPASQEVMMDQLLSPISGCGHGMDTVRIRFVNSGLNAVSGVFSAGYKESATAPAVIENFTATLQPGAAFTYAFNTLIDMSVTNQDSVFLLKSWVHFPGDPYPEDDTLNSQVLSKASAPPPAVTNASIAYGTATTLSVQSTQPVRWYDSFTGGTLLGSNPAYSTPLLYTTTVYYPSVIGLNTCPGIRARDTVFVGPAPPYEGAALSLVSPVNGINLSSTSLVKVTLKNYGTEPISDFPVSYSLDALPPVVDTVTTVLQPDSSLLFTFTVPADLSSFGNHKMKVWLDVPGDLNQDNDTVKKTITNSMHYYCTSSASSPDHVDIGRISLNTLSYGNAVPVFNNSGANNTYSYLGFLPPTSLKRGQDYPVSISPIWIGPHTQCYVKVFIDWDYNGYFDEANETAFTSGPTASNNTLLTGSIMVPLNAHIGLTTMRVVLVETTHPMLVYPCGTYLYGETEDYVVNINPQMGTDASITAIVYPPPIYIEGVNDSARVTLCNRGYLDITSADVYFQLDNLPPLHRLYTGVLTANNSVDLALDTLTWPVGYHQCCAWVVMQNDSNAMNDMVCRQVEGVAVDTLPYYDDFDHADHFIPTSSSNSNWILGAPQAGGFPGSAISPPNVWAVDLNHLPYSDSAECYLTTQIFDFTGVSSALLSFYIRYETQFCKDGVRLDYSPDNGLHWMMLGMVSDPNGVNWYDTTISSTFQCAWTGNSGLWLNATFKLFNVNQLNSMRFRFAFNSDGSTTGNGFALDNFNLTLCNDYDVGVDHIYSPTGYNDAGTQQPVTVRIYNWGLYPVTSVPVSYKTGNQPSHTETWTGLLNPSDSTIFTFSVDMNVPVGDYHFKSYTGLAGDADFNNDTTQLDFFGIPTCIPPYVTHFDSLTDPWFTVGELWELGTPTSNTINSAYSPPYCWKTNLDGIYPHAPMQYLLSPKFDFSVIGMDTLRFYHWVHNDQNDWARVEYLAVNGIWKKLGALGSPAGTNWYNTANGWIRQDTSFRMSSFDLKSILDFAVPTQFRFTFNPASNNNVTKDGWAVDDFELTYPRLQYDAGVISIPQPSAITNYGNSLVVKAEIKNFGWDTLTNIPVKYKINGITAGNGTFPGPLYPDSTAVFTFNPIPSPMSDYTLCAFTDVNFDTYLYNDTTCKFITVGPPEFDFKIVDIIQPVSQTPFQDSVMVEVTLMNLGLSAVTEVPLTFTVQSNQTVVSETWQSSVPLQTGQSVNYTFQTKYLFDFLGYYYLCVYSDHIDDGYHDNDTLCRRLESHYAGMEEFPGSGLYLGQNVPNPASEQTLVHYILPRPGKVTFIVSNALGQVIWMKEETGMEGRNQVIIPVNGLAPGVYLYGLTFDDKRLIRKMVVNPAH